MPNRDRQSTKIGGQLTGALLISAETLCSANAVMLGSEPLARGTITKVMTALLARFNKVVKSNSTLLWLPLLVMRTR